MNEDPTLEEFCARFKARMVAVAGPRDDTGDPSGVERYADQVAPTYFAEPDQREEGPEACADTDISYWED